jgi:hypothetical protein
MTSLIKGYGREKRGGIHCAKKKNPCIRNKLISASLMYSGSYCIKVKITPRLMHIISLQMGDEFFFQSYSRKTSPLNLLHRKLVGVGSVRTRTPVLIVPCH